MKEDVTRLGRYWDSIAHLYNDAVNIVTDDFHYGPLVPGDRQLGLLPDSVDGLRCLEIGAGAGQNSIYLAKKGAECIATDISDKQLEFGRQIAVAEGVDVDFDCVSMEELSAEKYGSFDLIHTSYAITFSLTPAEVVRNWSDMLNEGGTLMLSTGHPLFTGEWLDLDGESGLFITDYFRPQPDVRYDDAGNERIRSNFYSISDMSEWFHSAGLVIERILEPEPIDISGMSESQITESVPYSSKGWSEYYEQLKHVPGLIIFKCRKFC